MYKVQKPNGAIYDEIVDTTRPHVRGKGLPICRALPNTAELICRLLNENMLEAMSAVVKDHG